MPVTIQLNDALAAHLREGAASRQLSLEEFAVHLLGGALRQIEAADERAAQNRRRIDLIRKCCMTDLCAEEQVELQGLQTALDERLGPIDDRLLDGLWRWQGATGMLDTGPGVRLCEPLGLNNERSIEFDNLPEWLQAPIKKMRPKDYATWIHHPVAALQNRSVVTVLKQGQQGEEELRQYITKVIGYFFTE